MTRARFEELTVGHSYFNVRYWHRGRYCVTDLVKIRSLRNEYVLLDPDEGGDQFYTIALHGISAVKPSGEEEWKR